MRMAKKKQKTAIDPSKHSKTISQIFTFSGFQELENSRDREFTFLNAKSDIDALFVFKNVFVMAEYTTAHNPSEHYNKKAHIYNLLLNNKVDFIRYLLVEVLGHKELYNKCKDEYGESNFIFKIVYASHSNLDPTNHWKTNSQHVVYIHGDDEQYMLAMAKAVHLSFLPELFERLNIEFSKVADNALSLRPHNILTFETLRLKEAFANLPSGCEIVSFYASPHELIQHSKVLRNTLAAEHGFYQRLIIAGKIKTMRASLSKGCFYSNNIIVSMQRGEGLTIEDSNHHNSIAGFLKVDILRHHINIIDGQHRLFAYHEATDDYESKIKLRRKQHKLLVTSIIFPENISPNERLRHEAQLFHDINANQKPVDKHLTQLIEIIINPYSDTAIAHKILDELNRVSPLENKIARKPEEKAGKVPRAAIVAHGLRSLISRSSNSQKNGLYNGWISKNQGSSDLEDDSVLTTYIQHCVSLIRMFIQCFKEANASKNIFEISKNDKHAILNATILLGIIKCMSLIFEKHSDFPDKERLLQTMQGMHEQFDYKNYRSSLYSKLGKEMYQYMCQNGL